MEAEMQLHPKYHDQQTSQRVKIQRTLARKNPRHKAWKIILKSALFENIIFVTAFNSQ